VSEVWQLDSSAVWKSVELDSAPPLRVYHGGVVLDAHTVFGQFRERYYIFGGSAPQRALLYSDLWALDLGSLQWQSLPLQGAPPTGRQAFAMASFPDTPAPGARVSRFVLFGGWGTDGAMNDTFVFDENNKSWTKLSLPVAPTARGGCSGVYIAPIAGSQCPHGCVFIFSGYDAITRPERDAWVFDTQEFTWSPIVLGPDASIPAPRALYCIAAYSA
jgi:hypothetical protein